MRGRDSLAIGAGLALLIVPLVVAPASAKPSAHSDRDKVIAYWTPARMAAAQPRDFVKDSNGKFVQRRKPGGGGGGGGGGLVTGQSFAGNGEVRDRVGKVYFHMGGGDWQCSGSVVSDQGRSGFSMVLTAGHCAIDETNGTFATNWLFIPSWDRQPGTFSSACTASLYGCWTTAGGGGLYVDNDFATAGSFNDQAVTHDWAFAVVGPGGKSPAQQLDGIPAIGAGYSLGINTVSSGDRLAAFGFPAAGKYHGNDLTWCANKIFVDVSSSNGSSNNATWGMGCDMTGGSSGGPWFAPFSGGSGTMMSVNSYGYSGVTAMHGPKLNAETQTMFNTAASATTNTIVP